jgi:hypothetical protein
VTDGHIVTIVQNLIEGHGPFFKTAGFGPEIKIHLGSFSASLALFWTGTGRICPDPVLIR